MANYFELITIDHDSSVFIQADAKQFRMRLYNFDQIELPVSSQKVLIDSRVFEKTQTHFMISHHDRIGFGIPPCQIGTLDGGSR